MVVLQRVQVVRFDDQVVVLRYRWPWLDQTIPYHSIRNIKLADDRPFLTLSGAHPDNGFPVKIVIAAVNQNFEINTGPAEWRHKAEAIYLELQRHSSEFSHGESSLR